MKNPFKLKKLGYHEFIYKHSDTVLEKVSAVFAMIAVLLTLVVMGWDSFNFSSLRRFISLNRVEDIEAFLSLDRGGRLAPIVTLTLALVAAVGARIFMDFSRKIHQGIVEKKLLANKSEIRKRNVFLAYSEADAGRVLKIEEALIDGGFRVVKSTEPVGIGGHWSDSMEKTISGADFFVPVLSKNTNMEMLQKEYDAFHSVRSYSGDQARGRMIGAMIDNVVRSLSVDSFRFVDLSRNNDYVRITRALLEQLNSVKN